MRWGNGIDSDDAYCKVEQSSTRVDDGQLGCTRREDFAGGARGTEGRERVKNATGGSKEDDGMTSCSMRAGRGRGGIWTLMGLKTVLRASSTMARARGLGVVFGEIEMERRGGEMGWTDWWGGGGGGVRWARCVGQFFFFFFAEGAWGPR